MSSCQRRAGVLLIQCGMTRVDMPADYAQLPHVKQYSGGVDHLSGTQDFAMSSAPVVNIDPSASYTPPTLAEMRSYTPICFVPELNATLITRRDDIHSCEKNVAVFSSDQPSGLMNVLMGQNMMRKDGDRPSERAVCLLPGHQPQQVKTWWSSVFEQLTNMVLDDLVDRGSADLVPTYAIALSGEALKVITGLTNATFQEIND